LLNKYFLDQLNHKSRTLALEKERNSGKVHENLTWFHKDLPPVQDLKLAKLQDKDNESSVVSIMIKNKLELSSSD